MDIKQTIQDLILPELKTMQGDLKELRSEVKHLDDKTGRGFSHVQERISDIQSQINFMREDFKLALEIHSRLAALEARVKH